LQVAVLSLPALKPRLQEMRWFWLSWNSSARATGTSVTNDSATPRQIFMTRFIRIIPMANFANMDSRLKLEDSRDAAIGKSQSRRKFLLRPMDWLY
jgi:hypothetical protein